MLNATHTTCAPSAPPPPPRALVTAVPEALPHPSDGDTEVPQHPSGASSPGGNRSTACPSGQEVSTAQHREHRVPNEVRSGVRVPRGCRGVVGSADQAERREGTTTVYFIAFAWVRTPEVPSCWRGDSRVHIFLKGVCCARTQIALCRKVACCVFFPLPPNAFVFELKLHRCCCPALVVVPTNPGHRSPSKYQPATVGHSSASGNRYPFTALGLRRRPATRRGSSGAISDSSSAVGSSSGAIRNLRSGRHDSRNRGSSKA